MPSVSQKNIVIFVVKDDMDIMGVGALQNFADIFDTEIPHQVLNDYCNRARPGKDKVNYKKFKQDFNNTLPVIREQIECQRFKFTRFELDLKLKNHYKLPRLIFQSSIRDRFVAKLMCIYFQDHYAMINNGKYSLIKTRNKVLDDINKALSEKTQNGQSKYKFFLRLDISNFFDSINRSYLIKLLEEEKFDQNFIYLVKKLFTTMDLSMDVPSGFGVPQGISVSSFLAELYLQKFEEKFKTFPYNQNIICFRYVDDIFVLSIDARTLKAAKRNILFELTSVYGLSINDEKIIEGELTRDSVDFLGITVSNSKISISKSQVVRVERQLNELFLWYKRVSKSQDKSHPLYQKQDRIISSLLVRLNLFITGYLYTKKDSAQKGRYGWIQTSLPHQIENTDALKKLDRHVGALIEHYIPYESRKYVIESKKSFYHAFCSIKYKNNTDEYILDRDIIANDEEKMYRIVCDLSFVDIKRDLKYDHYERNRFEENVGEPLRSYFEKSLYITNRDLTADILYW